MNHIGFVKLFVMHHLFQTQSRKKEKDMFYVASVIIFSVFLELLRKSTLLVHYKLKRFLPPQVSQFDISALLVR